MRKLIPLLSVAVMFSFVALAWAVEVKTITGEGQCAKCSLGETDSCQNAIVTKEGDKKVTYYLVHNAVSKKFHKNVCKDVKKITATGDVKEEGGKKTLEPTKIDVAD